MTADLAHIRYSEMWGKQLPLQLRSEIHPVLQFCFTEPPNASTALIPVVRDVNERISQGRIVGRPASYLVLTCWLHLFNSASTTTNFNQHRDYRVMSVVAREATPESDERRAPCVSYLVRPFATTPDDGLLHNLQSCVPTRATNAHRKMLVSKRARSLIDNVLFQTYDLVSSFEDQSSIGSSRASQLTFSYVGVSQLSS